jgi:hypothetical protein
VSRHGQDGHAQEIPAFIDRYYSKLTHYPPPDFADRVNTRDQVIAGWRSADLQVGIEVLT